MSEDAPDEDEESVKLPFRRFLIQELRKALVPILVALLAGGAAGSGVTAYQEDDRIREARQAAEQEILRLEEVRNKLREEVQEYLKREASWDEVGAALKADKAEILDRVMADYELVGAPTGPDVAQRSLNREWVQQALQGEIKHAQSIREK